jgi:LppP/LprE lipoprotein
MTATRRNALATALALGTATLLAACGSGTKTVTVSSAPPVSRATSTQSAPPQTRTTPSRSTSTPTTSGTQSTSTSTTSTHSAPEPAFTEGATKSEGASAAAAIVRAHGYTPNDTAEYHSGQTLRVLVGTQASSSDGYGQQAFFFIDGRYLGTDTKEPSATVKVVSQADTEVTLAYPLYRKGDPLSGPSGGEARVTFQLNNGQLVPLQKIPSATQRN